MSQACLFEPKPEMLLDNKTGRLLLLENTLSADAAETFFDSLRNNIEWRQDKIRIAGHWRPIPRLQAWYGDGDARYGYPGLSLSPLCWTPELLELKNLAELHCATRFNSVLLNLYRDGQDGMGWHSDDEAELGTEPVIASLSLGSSRYFSLRQRAPATGRMKLPLDSGSLLVMSGALQQHWQHQVPKTALPVSERINLTFRLIQC